MVLAASSQAGPIFLGPSPYRSFWPNSPSPVYPFYQASTPIWPLAWANGSPNDYSPFYGGNFNYFYLETFESGKFVVPGVSASAGAFNGPGPTTDSVDADDGIINGSGLLGHTYLGAGATSLTFTFNANTLGTLPTHAGIVWTDVGFQAPIHYFGNVTFEAFGPGGGSLGTVGPIAVGEGLDSGQTPEDRFFGVVNFGGISAIRISMGNTGDWEVDHLQFGAATEVVPEPCTLVTFGILSLLAVGRARRKRGRPGRDHGAGMQRL